jgi:ribosomal subunit interface protein
MTVRLSSLRVSGKNVDIGEALRGRIETRVEEIVRKYFDGGYSGHATVEREGSGFRTDCAIHLDTGVVLQTSANAGDANQSFDKAAEHIDKRLRRYKRKLKARPSGPSASEPGVDAAAYVLASPHEEEEVEADYAPVVVAEALTRVRTLTVGMAVMELDLTEAPVVVFRSAAHGGLNVVYRRADGNIGWIDPALSGNGG